ncbi:oligo-1,6-glucosidase [Microdochium nivale]|nr:oligo-1,6-glucosidase [Microdochium nivale]
MVMRATASIDGQRVGPRRNQSKTPAERPSSRPDIAPIAQLWALAGGGAAGIFPNLEKQAAPLPLDPQPPPEHFSGPTPTPDSFNFKSRPHRGHRQLHPVNQFSLELPHMPTPPMTVTGTPGSSQPWWKDAVVYQIYPASFMDANGDGLGDLAGITSKLDYLDKLGVDVVWICPMYDSPQYDLGYDIADYEAIYKPYGDLADMQTLIDGCHARNMRLILDLVINHTSHQHAWFQQSRSSRDSPKRDWYIWKPAKHDPVSGKRQPPNNWRSNFGGSAWTWDEATGEYYLHLFAPEQPDLNWENPETRQAIYNSAMRFWLDRGVDGFRIDTVNMYSKPPTSPTPPSSTRRPSGRWPPACTATAHACTSTSPK